MSYARVHADTGPSWDGTHWHKFDRQGDRCGEICTSHLRRRRLRIAENHHVHGRGKPHRELDPVISRAALWLTAIGNGVSPSRWNLNLRIPTGVLPEEVQQVLAAKQLQWLPVSELERGLAVAARRDHNPLDAPSFGVSRTSLEPRSRLLCVCSALPG